MPSGKTSVPSPCIAVCTVDEESGQCLGCARTLQEVARWRRMPDVQKRQVLAALPKRKADMVAAGIDVRWRN